MDATIMIINNDHKEISIPLTKARYAVVSIVPEQLYHFLENNFVDGYPDLAIVDKRCAHHIPHADYDLLRSRRIPVYEYFVGTFHDGSANKIFISESQYGARMSPQDFVERRLRGLGAVQ